MNTPSPWPLDAVSDETILIPQPGGRRASAISSPVVAPSGVPANVAPMRAAPSGAGHAERAPLIATASGLNPLVRSANPLLDLALPLRTLPACADVEGLRVQLLQMVKVFEAEARASGYDTERLAAARYCLCTCIDEAISGTPWGSGMWASRSLLVTFHNEASGGERFFLILQRLAQDPARNVDVLELIYVMLSLGFEGRYRLLEGGRAQLESVRERLAQIIRVQRGSFEAELSVHWQPVQRARRSLTQRVPLWVAAALAGVVLVATHLALGVSLNRASDPVFNAFNGIRVSAPPLMPAVAAAQPAATAKLATFLAPEIAQGLVTVRDSADRSVVTINGDGLFASGSAVLEAAYQPLVTRIAQALQAVPGKVVVTGHTDNQPPLSTRFPSNWNLSQARADSVRNLLAAITGTPARLSAEGRGDAEPLASNDTAAGRAKNRRVEITLLAPGASS
ncbi:DotU family type VI secretion system protein [Paraburkholderia aromaticivorans]|uniref:DotU family type VI secretion system protein n=1 Tax=Paraburkholderia aromaticivorans TaxID=2026199 RepID=UPI001455F078|nr:DotU family type VI secretion system protein [Paraburkholderia aromaticivorans]